MGGNAGDMGIGLEFKNFHEALGAFHEATQDPLFQDVSRKRWDDPAGDALGPFSANFFFLKKWPWNPGLAKPCRSIRFL